MIRLRRPWLRVWLVMLGLSVLLTIVAIATNNAAVIPAVLFYGSAAGPAALLVATHQRTAFADAVPLRR